MVRRTILFLALAAATAGCRTARNSANTDVDLQVTVVNDLTPPRDVTISIVSNRFNKLLGDVPPQATRTFTVNAPVPTDFQLVAAAQLSRRIVSQTFNVTSYISGVTWRMQQNAVLETEQ